MANERPDSVSPRPCRVGFFVTCLVDAFRPTIGFAAIELLRMAGCHVEVPRRQTCCGQPAYNSGDARNARRLAAQVIEAFEGYDYVVAPSGSCASMLKVHYPALFPTGVASQEQADHFAGRCHELLSFLHDHLGFAGIDAELEGDYTYHDSCSGLRELGVRDQPRALLARVRSARLREMGDSDVCCGFGGTFCVKYPEISERLVADKVASISQTGAETLLGGDLGCLLNIAGRLRRESLPIKVFHAAEVLAGMANIPSIGEGEAES
jgi:L-lactate dehydrogenase complex protein LldE